MILTSVLPAVPPKLGVTFDSVGDEPRYVNPLVKLNASAPHVSETSTTPAACGGVVAVIELALTKLLLAAGVPPKRTVHSERRFAPLIVTEVPPAAGPFAGDTCVIAGVVGGAMTLTST